MNLYKISQDINNDYDTYDEAIVCAESEEAARNTHPCGLNNSGCWSHYTWVSKDKVKVEYIGMAKDGLEAGVIVSSFNAG